jgi:heme-degrading monooxygenase HmoA
MSLNEVSSLAGADHKALINLGSLTYWIDEEAIAEWKQNEQGKRGRPR